MERPNKSQPKAAACVEIIGLFAWHLKATLLIHQNQKE